jgi:hypothetical protein
MIVMKSFPCIATDIVKPGTELQLIKHEDERAYPYETRMLEQDGTSYWNVRHETRREAEKDYEISLYVRKAIRDIKTKTLKLKEL